jgi:glycosyltransferase involved in cell wall biosynthesis
MDPKSKVFRPDKFIMVSPWIAKKFSSLGVEIDLLEYPIEDFTPDKNSAIQALELDPAFKHVLNVGLFTPGKNQREAIDLASKFLDLPVQFHFVGNRAPNFKDYWEPLLSGLHSNCKIWGERSDVDLFYQAADLFLFTSNLELNPLCLKEALSWKLPVFCKRLPAYLDSYDSNDLVSYLKGDLEKDAEKMKNFLFH